jgi:kynurenine formamidase
MNIPRGPLIDLSVTLGPNPSEVVPVTLDYMDHRAGGVHLAQLTGVDPAELPNGLGWASERLGAITHTGTHIDAPHHLAPTCRGLPSRTIDELPLEWFCGEAVCIPCAGGREGDPITEAEIGRFERDRGARISGATIVLFRTGAEDHHGRADYVRRGRPISPGAVRSLAGRGVRVLGTDAWSIDPPFEEGPARDPGPDPPVWAAHFVGYEAEFCIIERLTNLNRLPPTGFWVACFPVKVLRGSAGWVRPVAFLDRGPKE